MTRRQKWLIRRDKGKFKMQTELPRVYLPQCAICNLPLSKRNPIAARLFAGQSSKEVAKAVGVTHQVMWKHMTRCIPQLIEATHRYERQRDIDHISDLQSMVLQTFDFLKAGIQAAIENGETAEAVALGQEFICHIDGYARFFDNRTRVREREAASVIRALSVALVEIDPVRGAEAVDDTMAANPAIQNILDEESGNV